MSEPRPPSAPYSMESSTIHSLRTTMGPQQDEASRPEVSGQEMNTSPSTSKGATPLSKGADDRAFTLLESASNNLPTGDRENVVLSAIGQHTLADLGPSAPVPSTALTARGLRTDYPIVRLDIMFQQGFAETEWQFPARIDGSIDGSGFPIPASRDKPFTGGSKNLAWAYATHTGHDQQAKGANLWLFEKPKGYYTAQLVHDIRRGLGVVKAPLILLPPQDLTPNAMKNLNGEYLHVTAQGPVRNDIRTLMSHPDFMTPTILREYQACEVAGENMWRHDRNLLSCRMTGCSVQIADSNPTNIFCLSCGPKTIIRYCSVQHLIADMKEHWTECGHKDLVISQVIDHTTEPARFSHLCPALGGRKDSKSYENHRQKVYAQITQGHYTLFDVANETPLILVWPDSDPRKKEMESRIERTLNIAFFQHDSHNILVYLYKLVRECLQLKNGWIIGTQYVLAAQLNAEFQFDPTANPDIMRGEPLRESDWDRVGELVEQMEGEHWILRAWRQQHPTVEDWRERVMGTGFPGVDLEDDWEPNLGAGWEGYGAKKSNVRE